jgi:hypothetical protein
MLEYFKDPIVIQIAVACINIIAAIIVIISALVIRKNRRHIERTTKLLGEASGHLEKTFDSMLNTMVSLSELRKMNPQAGDIHVQIGKKKKTNKAITKDDTIVLTEEVKKP